MRITLDIDEDVLWAVKELATAQRKTAGKVISELAREAIRRGTGKRKIRNGFELLPPGGAIVTSELVRKLLEEEP